MQQDNKWYDTLALIPTFTTDLKGLHELIEARAEAAFINGRKEPVLKDIVIRGTWWLDAFGQVGYIDPEKVRAPERFGSGKVDLSELRSTNSVLTAAQFYDHIGGPGAEAPRQYDNIHFPPEHGTLCQCCAKAFTIDDAHTAVSRSERELVVMDRRDIGLTLKQVRDKYRIRNGVALRMRREETVRNDRWINNAPVENGREGEVVNPYGWAAARGNNDVVIDWDEYQIQEGDEVCFTAYTYTHAQCAINRLTDDHRHRVYESLCAPDVGVTVSGTINIPNEYGSASYRGDWLFVQTSVGDFKIGWRRRVLWVEPARMSRVRGVTNSYSSLVIEDAGNGFEAADYKQLGELFFEKFIKPKEQDNESEPKHD